MSREFMALVTLAWLTTGPASGSQESDHCVSDEDCDEDEGLYCALPDDPDESSGCGKDEPEGVCELRPDESED